MAFGGPAEVLELVQAKRPMFAIDKDVIEVELPQMSITQGDGKERL